MHEKILWNPQTFCLFLFYTVQREFANQIKPQLKSWKPSIEYIPCLCTFLYVYVRLFFLNMEY